MYDYLTTFRTKDNEHLCMGCVPKWPTGDHPAP